MKRLTLVRHAKSSWGRDGLCDHERPLNDRGLRDAPLMGRVLADRIEAPDVILCSPAVRARATAELMAKAMGLDAGRVREDERIYDADAGSVLAVIRGLHNTGRHVFLVGHYPSLLDLANLLCGQYIEHLPTCGTVLLKTAAGAWSALGPGACTLDELLYPKMFAQA